MIRLGILGGGQLAQMLTQAAVSLGVETAIFERKPDSPAARLTHFALDGEWTDTAKLKQFADWCDVITLENEFVDAAILDQLAALGTPLYPTGATLRQIQDKYVQKQAMQAADIPLPALAQVTTAADIQQFAAAHGWPLVLKARRDGYDGYGNATLKSAEDIPAALDKLQGRELLVEAWVPFVKELAVMVLRGRDGEILTYPVVETVQENHICRIVRAPAPLDAATAAQAESVARQAVTAIDGVGVFGVELFLLEDGSVIYNEIAPRPHNSGHYTIEACVTSQFENHIRVVLGWPLGDPSLVKPAAVMVNVLGRYQGDAPIDAAQLALQVPGAHLHIYSKRAVRVGRKMGHVTVLADDIATAEAAAQHAADLVKL